MLNSFQHLKKIFAPPTQIRSESGIIGVIGILLFSSVILTVGAGMVVSSSVTYKIAADRLNSTQTSYNADSGAEDALLHIRRSTAYGNSPTTLTTTFDSKNSVTSTVDTPSGGSCAPTKSITSAGYYAAAVRRIQLTNCASPSDNAQFIYALQAGAGGIQQSNNSTINGSSYSNGNHTGGNGASVTGDAYVAGAAAPTPAPSYDPPSPTDYLFANVTTNADVAQAFTADTSTSSQLIKLQLKVKKVGTPANPTIGIMSDSAGKPGTRVASGVLSTPTVGLTSGFVDVTMTTPPTLTNGSKYWIVFDGTYNASNYWGWASQSGYGGGNALYTTDYTARTPTWTDPGVDMAFKVFMGTTPTSLSSINVGGDAHANTLSSVTVARDAYYQTKTGGSVGRNSYPNSADPAAAALPISESNVTDFQNEASSGTVVNGDVTVNGTQTIGPEKINGNLIVNLGATLNMEGTIWVTGTITFGNNSHLNLVSGYGAASGVIMSDGIFTLSNNMQASGSGTFGSYIMALSTSNSQTAAIDVSNNAASLILAATQGFIHINNNGSANTLAGYGLSLANNASVTYTTGLSNVQFSAGPGASFQVHGWKEVVL